MAGFGLAVGIGMAVAGLLAVQVTRDGSGRQAGDAQVQRAATATSATVPRNGSRPLTVPVTLKVSGVVDGLGPGTSPTRVTLRSGSRTYDATLSGNTYTANLSGLDHSGMVSVEVEAPRVRYRSIVGSFLSLKIDSRGDRAVTVAEHPALRVSPWSTSLAWLVERGLGGAVPSDAEYRRVLGSVNGTDAIKMAYVLARFAEGTFDPMPPHATGMALVEDESAYRALLSVETPDVLAQEWMIQQADGVPVTSLASLPASFGLLGARPVDDLAASQTALVLINAGGNAWRFASSEFESPPLLDASLVSGGVVRLVPQTPWVREKYESVELGYSLIRQELQSIQLKRLTASTGAGKGLWAVQRDWLDTAVYFPELPPRSRQDMVVLNGVDLDAAARPVDWALQHGEAAMPWLCRDNAALATDQVVLKVCEYALHQFVGHGTGVVLDFGPKVDKDLAPAPGAPGSTFQWSSGPGNRLTVVGPEASTRFWLLDAADSDYPRLVYSSGNASGESLAGVTLALVDEGVTLSSSDIVGSWLNSFSIATPILYPDPGLFLFFERNPDGTAQERSLGVGEQEQTVSHRWIHQDGILRDTRYQAYFPDGSRKRVLDCAAAIAGGADKCIAERSRYFRPLRRIFGRVFGIEHIYYNPEYLDIDDSRAQLVASRPNFYECDSGACSGAAAVSAPATASAYLQAERPDGVRTQAGPRSRAPGYHGAADASGSTERVAGASSAGGRLQPAVGLENWSRSRARPMPALIVGQWLRPVPLNFERGARGDSQEL
jgi:hypothetical protein